MVERATITLESLQTLSEEEETVLEIIKDLNAIEEMDPTWDILIRQAGREGISERKTAKIVNMLLKLKLIDADISRKGNEIYIDTDTKAKHPERLMYITTENGHQELYYNWEQEQKKKATKK